MKTNQGGTLACDLVSLVVMRECVRVLLGSLNGLQPTAFSGNFRRLLDGTSPDMGYKRMVGWIFSRDIKPERLEIEDYF